MVNRNPVYHQVVFASIVIATAVRITYILKYTSAAKRIPPIKKGEYRQLLHHRSGSVRRRLRRVESGQYFLWAIDGVEIVLGMAIGLFT